jgi:TetR/AcrR family transcriptional regulator, tetracycline repressor protein
VSRRDEVLQAALDLLDDVGLDALTTRRLADKLGVRPGALYRHFDSKRALLDAMVERLVGGQEDLPSLQGEWPDQLRALATGARAAMLTRRDGARLVVTYLQPGQAGQQAWNHFLDMMRAAGFDADNAALALDTVFAYVNGFTIEEQARDGFPQPPERRAWRDTVFQSGLNLIITGIHTTMTTGTSH